MEINHASSLRGLKSRGSWDWIYGEMGLSALSPFLLFLLIGPLNML
jgi:hypothetical protein